MNLFNLRRVESIDSSCKGCCISNLCAKFGKTTYFTNLECTDYDNTVCSSANCTNTEYVFKWVKKPEKYIPFNIQLYRLLSQRPNTFELYVQHTILKYPRKVAHIAEKKKWSRIKFEVMWRQKEGHNIIKNTMAFNKFGLSQYGTYQLLIRIKY